MAKLIISETSQNGVQGVTKRKPGMGESYKKLIKEADKRIDEDRSRYAKAYKRASAYLAR